MSQAARNWSAFDYKSWDLVVSPSAVETADDCLRKWTFLKVHRLKEPQKDFTQLGDVFHEVCERWLSADDTGRGADGEPVELFPDGWADRLSFGQEAVVRALHKAMVEAGILRRTPGRQIEKAFQIGVLPNASMMGFADVWTPQGIEDHKTSKARRWLATQGDLRQSIQMMSYATAWLVEEIKKGDVPLTVELRHNQGITDPEDLYVRPTSVDVSVEDVSDFWDERIVPLVKQMLYWKQAKVPAESWEKIPGPKKKGICRKYGGCPFQGICGRTESITDYKSRVTLHNQQFEVVKAQEKQMSEDLLAKLAARKKARANTGVSTPAPVTPAPAADETEPVSEAVEASKANDVAPWAQAGCKACSGSGIASSGVPCRPCTVQAEKIGIMVQDFQFQAVEGAVQISRGGNLLATVPVAVEVKTADNTKPARSEKKSEAKAAEKPSESSSESKTRSRGRPKKSFTLLYGLPKRHSGKIIDLGMVMQEFGAKLAEEWNAGSFWAIDAFKRREALAHKSQEIAETFGSALVVVTSTQRDLADFATAIEPFAANVYGSLL